MAVNEFPCRVSSVGRRGVFVLDEDGEEHSAVVAGKVYHQLQPAAGDRAVATRTGDRIVIEEVLPRTSTLQRPSPSGRSVQVIAANVDLVLVVSSLQRPDFSNGFVSRALVASCWREISATLVLNKMDLCTDPLLEERDRILRLYGHGGAGYPVFPVSCRTGRGTVELLDHIRGRTVVMTGPSGAGKTSLAKVFNPAIDIRIGSVNPKTAKGRHTTVAARLVPLDHDTALIDTPGLRMFSIEHVPREQLQFCFPEFGEYLGKCRFRDCLHLSEPGCCVKAAVEEERIHRLRYELYASFMDELGS